MNAKLNPKALLQASRCGSSPDSTMLEQMAAQMASLEWKLRQEREKVRRLEQRLADIVALEGGAFNDQGREKPKKPGVVSR